MWKITELITLRAKEPIRALQKPQRSLNPVTKAAAKPKIIALMIKVKKQKVMNVMGAEIKLKIGRNTALRIPKTTADIKALLKESISTPVGSLEIINILTAVTNKVIRKAIISNSLLNDITQSQFSDTHIL